MSFTVAQRSRELGVRMALGAIRSALLRMVLSEGVLLTLPGLLQGLAAALAAAHLLDGLLFEVTALDPATYAVATPVLGLACLAASYLPARRATRVDPISALR